jgi:hypothetical protein
MPTADRCGAVEELSRLGLARSTIRLPAGCDFDDFVVLPG